MNLIVNGDTIVLQDDSTLLDLCRQINADPQRVAVLVNDEVVPSVKRQTYVLRNNDRVEVLALAGGG